MNEHPAASDEITEEKSEKKGRSKAGSVINTVVNVILVIAIILAGISTYLSFVSKSGNGVPSIFGLEFFSVQTPSMYPTMNEGDLIFSKKVKDVTKLEKGTDIISYWTIIDGERAINTHRIYEIYDGGGYLIFATKGDNNPTEDPLTVHESEIVGKYTGKKIAGAGKVFDFLQTPTGFGLIVVLPVAVFFLFHLIQFFRALFEYQSVKNRLKFEAEQAGAASAATDEEERARLEAEIRAKVLAELKEQKLQESGGEQKDNDKKDGDGDDGE
ncbi:MAG: signal peptidase I [Clostridia bacterium]|nr:signal peptidase I [Clostridia bacterium]